MQPTTLQSEYYKEIFKVEIFQGRNINDINDLNVKSVDFVDCPPVFLEFHSLELLALLEFSCVIWLEFLVCFLQFLVLLSCV